MEFAGYKFDDKFLVLKWEDIELALTDDEISQLGLLISIVARHRENRGKTSGNAYLVVNIDEDYANKIAEIIAENHGIERIDK
jgi:hypothetical protein